MTRWFPLCLALGASCEPADPWVPEVVIGELRDVREIPNAAVARVFSGADRPCSALFDPMPAAPLDPTLPAPYGWFCPVGDDYVLDITPLTPARPGEPSRIVPLLVRNESAWGSVWLDWTPTEAWSDTPGADLVRPVFTEPVELLPRQIQPLYFQLDDRAWRMSSGEVSFAASLSLYFVDWGQKQDVTSGLDITDRDRRWREWCATDDGEADAAGDCSPFVPFGVRYTIDCDRDQDGHEAIACGGDDCADLIPAIHVGADEICDSTDNNCDGIIDDDAIDQTVFYRDNDLDGFGYAGAPEEFCWNLDPWWTQNSTDCDDRTRSINPLAPELCGNTIDENCDGETPPCE